MTPEAFFIPFAILLVLVLKARNHGSWHVFDAAFLLPWICAFLSRDALLPLLAFHIHALLYLFLWSQKADRVQTEALSKFAVALFLGTFLTTGGYLLFQAQSSFVLWPFDQWSGTEGIWMELIGASMLSGGIFLLWGLPPLQQGWVDIAEAWGPDQQIRIQILLRASLLYSFWSLVPFFKQVFSPPMLSGIALAGILGLVISRLVQGVQMSVWRCLAYQSQGSIFGFLVFLALGSHDTELLSRLGLGLSFASLFVMLVAFIPLFTLPAGMRLHWDDPQLPASSLFALRVFMGWEIGLSLVASGYFFFLNSYVLALVCLLFAVCGWSLLQDRVAFRSRSPDPMRREA